MARRHPDAIDSVCVLASVFVGVVALSFGLALLLQAAPAPASGSQALVGRRMPAPTMPIGAVVAGIMVPFLLGPLVYAFALKRSVVESFLLRPPRPRTVFFVLLASAGSMWLLNGIVTIQEYVLIRAGMGEYVRSAERRLETQFLELLVADPAYAIFLFSLVPAICEEFLFRGIVLRGFRESLGTPVALLGTAAIFAVVHVEPIKMLPMFLLGLFFAGLVILTRSLWSSVLAHAANNLAVLVVSYVGHQRGVDIARYGTWYVYAISVVAFGLAVACLVADYRDSRRCA